MPKLRYIDNRRKNFKNMKCFGSGLTLPKDDFVLECSDKEAEALLKLRNGRNPIFEKAGGGRRKKEDVDIDDKEQKIFE